MSRFSDIVIAMDETNERGAPEVTVSRQGLQMLNDGLLCGRCLEDLRPLGAFPERCPCCGFHVKRDQTRQLIEDVKGHKPVGSRVSLSDELERLGEMWIPPKGLSI
jgi:predicted amidophosphoribosyltransferase